MVLCFEDDSLRRFVLVHHRSRGWELPGGRLEPDEAPLDAARREFAEETGRSLSSARLIEADPTLPWDHVVVGRLGPVAGLAPAEESVDEWRLVARLDEVAPLSFPNDPYDRLGTLMGRPL